ncbi:MAG: hypothetical protein PBV86_15940 [Delftia lacustris]|uniref:endonuclease/exonuclease/phosphatase family protein n=1 Tax=Delftia TaxID=80865 RepID=UPI001BCCC6B3|nr:MULTISPECIES: endonuclease/exonuclease/phosphatase family protein [unclassified Delftia]WON86315.1 endonuclease/exonuclease/phosphatase family protein [Delftia sp. UGAL515B_04]
MTSIGVDIFWWNANNYYHFDVSNSGDRWPKDLADYMEKCRRVDLALNSFFSSKRKPMILAICEITRKAAEDLRQRLFPDYEIISLDVMLSRPSLQIAILFKRDAHIRISEQNPIVVSDMPKSTRPMAVLDVEYGAKCVRMVFCHWQARFEDEAKSSREAMAGFLNKYTYDYLRDSPDRSILIMGDLNEDPFEEALNKLHAHRYRSRAGEKHYTDKDTRRVHLYNCTWRLLGEKAAYSKDVSSIPNATAGTYYWKLKKRWHSFDQIIVSHGLISKKSPHLDEEATHIVDLPEFLPEKLPATFKRERGGYVGLSDHLPIYTNIFF